MFRRTSHLPTTLLDSDLARHVPQRELDALDRLGTIVRLGQGREIIREDSVGRECMVVIEGSLDVMRRGETIGCLGAGDFVGEMALLNRAPRSATVLVREPTRAYAFSRRDFVSLLAECPVLAAHVRGLADARTLVLAA